MKIWTDKQTWLSKNARQKASTLNAENITRIAVIKHAGLGDMLATRPLLNVLKEAFPNAILTLNVTSNYIKGIPDDIVDRVHISKGNDKKYGFFEALRSFKELGPQDIIFDITMTNRSFWITLLNSATLKVGFKHKGLERFLYDIAISRSYYRFEAESFLELANIIGIQYKWPPNYDFPIAERSYQKPYIIYFPTSSTPERGWPLDYMAELIKQMCAKYPQHDHLLLAGLADWELEAAKSIANEVGTADNFKMLNAGADDFSLICHASALVSTDTGLRHLAIAANTPTVCFFREEFNIQRYLPIFGNHKAAIADESGPASVSVAAKAIDEILSQEA
ncbi:MAG: glycosyltransferase family 9 protein [Gammaproteobacteria bacterium]|nr:glycosyltransferase family 9 protein [Gammaproteobacteria bacterium]